MSDITSAIKQICDEKNLSYEAVVETIESALAAAYRKDFGEKNQNIKVEFEPETGKSKVYDIKIVVEDLRRRN
jgi:N utilization substance protein A